MAGYSKKDPYREMDTSFNVVKTALEGPARGLTTWFSFKNEERFNEWLDQPTKDGTKRKLRDVFQIVATGVSKEEALKICSTPQNAQKAVKVYTKSLSGKNS